MAGLPDGEKSSKIPLFVLTECTNVTDTHTDTHRDRHTPHDGIGRAAETDDDNDDDDDRYMIGGRTKRWGSIPDNSNSDRRRWTCGSVGRRSRRPSHASVDLRTPCDLRRRVSV